MTGLEMFPIVSFTQDMLRRFDCDNGLNSDLNVVSEYRDINYFLQERAHSFDSANLAKTFVMSYHNDLVGFFTTAAGLTSLKRVYRKRKQVMFGGLSIYPTVDIVYFAIDRSYQGMGIGKIMMAALMRLIIENVVTHTGVTLLTVQALEVATPFYQDVFAFEAHDSHNLHGRQNLALTIAEVQRILEN